MLNPLTHLDGQHLTLRENLKDIADLGFRTIAANFIMGYLFVDVCRQSAVITAVAIFPLSLLERRALSNLSRVNRLHRPLQMFSTYVVTHALSKWDVRALTWGQTLRALLITEVLYPALEQKAIDAVDTLTQRAVRRQ